MQTEFHTLDREELLHRASVAGPYVRFLAVRAEQLSELQVTLPELVRLLPELRFLDLSNSSKLNSAQLRQVFSCESVRAVRLSNACLDGSAIGIICQALAELTHVPTLTSLDLSDNNLGGESLLPLRKLVSMLPHLKQISLASNSFPLKAASDRNALLFELLSCCKSLELLDFGGNPLELSSFSEEVWRALCSSCNLRSLFLNDSLETTCPQEAFQAFVSNLPARLSYLNLANCSLEAPHMAMLYRALKDNRVLTHLDLSENSLGKDSCEFLSQLLQENSALRRYLHQLPSLSSSSIKRCGIFMLITTSSVSLNLKDNRLWDVGGAILANGLSKNRSLTRLNLGSNRLRAAAGTLASAARSHPSIRWLNLDQNQIPAPQLPLVRKALEGSALIVVM